MVSASATIPAGYKQTEVGVIPEDWDISAIDPLIDLLTGFPFPSSNFARIGIRLLRGANVKRGTLDWSENITEYWPSASYGMQQFILQDGDIVVAMDGSLVGRSFAQISLEDTPVLLVQRVARIRSKLIHINFLKEWVCSRKFTIYCDSVKTVTAVPHISPLDIKSFKIAYPNNVREQEKIAKSLSDSESLIQALEKLISKKRDIKQGTMQELLTGKTRLPGFSGEWELKSIGEIAQVIGGGTPSTQVSHYWGGTINWFTPTEVGSTKYVFDSERKLTDSGLQNSSSSLLPIGAILLTSRAGIGDLGILCGRACTNQGFQSMVCNDKVNNEFLYYVMLTKRAELERRSSGSTFLEINPRELKSLLISLPQINEQQAIAEVLSDMDAEIAALEQRLEKTKAIKQGMMQQLLTGRIRLVDPSTPVEASA